MAFASEAPAAAARAVTPSDSVDIPLCRALYIGTTGDLQITTRNSEVVAFTNVPVGVFPVQARRVWDTNTDAQGIVALY